MKGILNFNYFRNKPFSFGAQIASPTETDEQGNINGEEEESPKPDFKLMIEEGSIFQQCLSSRQA